jgi:hypothetical protein
MQQRCSTAKTLSPSPSRCDHALGEGKGWSTYRIEDILGVVSLGYLKLIRKCEIDVRMPYGLWTRAQESYLKHRKRIAAFAVAFRGDDHSLRKLSISFNKQFIWHNYLQNCMEICQKILEPLATIYGPGICVVIDVRPRWWLVCPAMSLLSRQNCHCMECGWSSLSAIEVGSCHNDISSEVTMRQNLCGIKVGGSCQKFLRDIVVKSVEKSNEGYNSSRGFT